MSVSTISSMTSTNKIQRDEKMSKNNDDVPSKLPCEDRYVKNVCKHEVEYNLKKIKMTEEVGLEEIKIEEERDFDRQFEESSKVEDMMQSLDSNDFNDSDCGEPLTRQYLSIDFSPKDDVDYNLHVQKKCYDFWQFIHNRPELQKFFVRPVYLEDQKTGASVISKQLSEKASNEQIEEIQTPAINWLKTKGIVSETVFTKERKPLCELYAEEYCSSDTQSHQTTDWPKKQGRDENGAKLKMSTAKSSRQSLLHICDVMDQWDKMHPKSMESPGRSPALSHAVLQALHEKGINELLNLSQIEDAEDDEDYLSRA